MRRMYSENQLIALIEQYGGQVTPEDIQEMFDDGKVSLDGKYVKVIVAPSDNKNLTDDEVNNIKGGCFINGSFLGYRNPVIFPYRSFVGGAFTGMIIGQADYNSSCFIRIYYMSKVNNKWEISLYGTPQIEIFPNSIKIMGKEYPSYPSNSTVGHFIWRKGVLQWYTPTAQDGITSGDTIAVDSNLGKALIDHLDVVINGYMARYEYTSGNYVVYSSKTEADSGAKLQVNMISYNTTNGTLAFNQMTFTPDN